MELSSRVALASLNFLFLLNHLKNTKVTLFMNLRSKNQKMTPMMTMKMTMKMKKMKPRKLKKKLKN
jgi:hypothetical protein